ncbi:unnamed protein product, partial [Ectocarpus sp. 8 AP-2014]
RAVPVTGEAAGFLPGHGFRSVKDVFRDLPPPFCPVFRGKYGCGLHCSVPSCRPFGCNAAELGASALDPPHQMSGCRRYGRTPRERDAEKCWAEHGSGASCAEATGCGTWVEAPGHERVFRGHDGHGEVHGRARPGGRDGQVHLLGHRHHHRGSPGGERGRGVCQGWGGGLPERGEPGLRPGDTVEGRAWAEARLVERVCCVRCSRGVNFQVVHEAERSPVAGEIRCLLFATDDRYETAIERRASGTSSTSMWCRMPSGCYPFRGACARENIGEGQPLDMYVPAGFFSERLEWA